MTHTRARRPQNARLVEVKADPDRPNKVIYVLQVPGNRSKQRKRTDVTKVKNKTDIFRPLKRVFFRVKGLKTAGYIHEAIYVNGGNVLYDELEVTFTPRGMSQQKYNEIYEDLKNNLW